MDEAGLFYKSCSLSLSSGVSCFLGSVSVATVVTCKVEGNPALTVVNERRSFGSEEVVEITKALQFVDDYIGHLQK